MCMKYLPELLSPAGTLKNMRFALAYGADAVYAGLPRYSLRVRNNDFLFEHLAIGIAEAHSQGKAFYLAANILPHNNKIKTFIRDLSPIVELGPDALIVADPGFIALAREAWPDLPLHLSVQANTMNYAAVRFWRSIGLQRIILSRELSLEEIAGIRMQCPDMELEVFIHGALCIAYSGRCLLSGYFNHRDANQGACTNACRWKYQLQYDEDQNREKSPLSDDVPFSYMDPPTCQNQPRHPLADKMYLIEEGHRPGEYMPIFEDEEGTYILNSKDLRAVEHIQRLVSLGINSLKIEGRTKSAYYVARTAQVYRQAIDDAISGRDFNPALLGVLENLAQRGYTDGFYVRHHTHAYQNYLQGHSDSHRQRFVGEIIHFDTEKYQAEVLAKNKFSVGDRLELILPDGNCDFTLEHIEDKHGHSLAEVPGGGWEVRIPVPKVGDYGLIARYL